MCVFENTRQFLLGDMNDNSLYNTDMVPAFNPNLQRQYTADSLLHKGHNRLQSYYRNRNSNRIQIEFSNRILKSNSNRIQIELKSNSNRLRFQIEFLIEYTIDVNRIFDSIYRIIIRLDSTRIRLQGKRIIIRLNRIIIRSIV